jgi:hypothetical protein
MQMLGLGGMALAVESQRPLSLFGSDAAPGLIRPDSSLLKGHVVVQAKGIIERIPPEEKVTSRYGKPVARLTRTRVPGGGELQSLQEHRLFIRGEFPFGEDGKSLVDPHMVYYKASMDLRKQFAQLSRAKLMALPKELQAGAVLVTVVESPILAASRYTWESEGITRRTPTFGMEEDRLRGFDVTAYFRQGIRYSTEGLNTFNIYSEMGEYPIDVPSDIDMAILMKLDKEVIADAGVLKRPRGWRPSARKTSVLFG